MSQIYLFSKSENLKFIDVTNIYLIFPGRIIKQKLSIHEIQQILLQQSQHLGKSALINFII